MSYYEGCLNEWIRVASLDKTSKNESCPVNLTEIVFNGSDYCGLQKFNASCSSVHFPVNTTYSNVSGTIRG